MSAELTKQSTLRTKWLGQYRFSLPISPLHSPPLDWVDQVINRLLEKLPRCVSDQSVSAFISLPPGWTLYQVTDADDIADAQKQCDDVFNGSLFRSPATITHWPVAVVGNQRQVAAVAIDAACRVTDAIASVGYQVKAILPHGAAVLHGAREITGLSPSAALLMQPSGTTIAIANQQNCGMCRQTAAPNLSDFLKSGDEQSLQTAAAWNQNVSLDHLQPWLDRLVDEFESTVRFANRTGPSSPKDAPVALCGQLAAIKGIDRSLAERLRRPVAIWQSSTANRPGNIANDQLCDVDRAVSLSLAYLSFRDDISIGAHQDTAEVSHEAS